MLVRAQITCIVGDEAALKSCWSFKGASGIVPCVQCRNCVSDASDLQRRSGHLFTTSTPHLNKCVPNDDQKFLELVKHLDSEKPNRTQKQFEQLEKAFGITLLEGMAERVESLLHVGIGPCSTLMYDWMHVYFVNGVWNSEVGRLGPPARSRTCNLGCWPYFSGLECNWCSCPREACFQVSVN